MYYRRREISTATKQIITISIKISITISITLSIAITITKRR